LENRPVQLLLPKHKNWSVATQLQKINDTLFQAPNYYYFYDSPTVYGKMEWRNWEIDGQNIRMAVMHEGTSEELDIYTDWTKSIVNEQKAVFGELPKFDFGEYTFLMMYNPYVVGDGMEHRNSTICSENASLKNMAVSLVGTVSHEFFHAWNIERIRPRDLEPFDFEKPNMTDALWFGEGLTQYYGNLILTRAGIVQPEDFIKNLIGSLNYVLTCPAREFRGPSQMSQFATFTDAGVSNDPTNYNNVFVSYYNYGQIIGLGLDLTLRSKYDTSLDDFMKLVWERHGKTEITYTLDDLQSILGELTNDQSFANSFFENQIYGSELPDFKSLFSEFGVKMSIQNPQSSYFNNPKIDKGILVSNLLKGTALYEAGMEKGDRLISINGFEVSSTARLNSIINQLEIDKTYDIVFEQMGEIVNSQFTTSQDPRVFLSYLDEKNLKKSEIKNRKNWLGIK